MKIIKVTAYGECLTNEPRPYPVWVNVEQITCLNIIGEGWTSVHCGHSTFEMKGNPEEVLAQLLSPLERTKALVDVGTAGAAVESARNLAAYLEKVRPDLEESIASIRGLERAIQNSLPENAKEADR